MIKNYIKVAYRNLIKNRFYSLLNIIGLSVGVASFLLILLYVTDELSYDRFHADADKIFRVTTHFGSESGSQFATAPPPLSKALKNELPEVEATTRLLKWNDFTIQPLTGSNKNNVFRETRAFYVEASFFDVFQLDVLAGNPTTALKAPNAIVITESTAKRYFGQEPYENILGQNVLLGSNDPANITITAIVKDLPANSHFHFDLLCTNSFMFKEIFEMENWGWPIMHTYIRLRENTDTGKSALEVLEAKANHIVRKFAIPSLGQGYDKLKEETGAMEFQLQPLVDIHLHSKLLREHEPNGSIIYVYIFTSIAILIIIIACINFVNLATAKSANRAKEVGVRKVLGSSKSHLIGQFLAESFILCFISTFFAVGIVEVSKANFNQISGKMLSFSQIDEPWLVGSLLLVVIILSVLSGAYPAFYLSAFKPITALKGKLQTTRGGLKFRSILVVFQFTISISLIVCAFVIYQQLSFIQRKNIGFQKENVLIIHSDGEIQDQDRESFKNSLTTHSSIISASFSTGIPAPSEFHVRSFNLPSNTTKHGFNWYQADESYLRTLNLSLADGRNFSDEIASDSSAVLLNETAVETLGLTDPVGKEVILNEGDNDEVRLHVVGVIKDFNFESFYQKVKPLVIQNINNYYSRDYVLLKIAPGNVQEALNVTKAQWKAFQPRVPLTYTFLDEDFDKLFHSEQRLGQVVSLFTGLAIFVACLGLLGLTAFSSEQRSKEIGIRKILGASAFSVVMLLSKQFTRLLLIAFLIALPVSFFMMQQWLNNFVYKIEIEVYVFVMAGVTTLFIAWLTISYQSIKAALANPIDALKDE